MMMMKFSLFKKEEEQKVSLYRGVSFHKISHKVRETNILKKKLILRQGKI